MTDYKTSAKKRAYAREYAAAQKAACPEQWRERRRATKLRFIAKHPGKWKAQKAAADSKRVRDPVKKVLSHMRCSATKRGVPFSMTADDVEYLFDTTPVCPVFGTPFQHGRGWHSPHSPSFDRFIPSLGYVPSNVRLISWRANILKRDASLDELRAVVAWMEAVQ